MLGALRMLCLSHASPAAHEEDTGHHGLSGSLASRTSRLQLLALHPSSSCQDRAPALQGSGSLQCPGTFLLVVTKAVRWEDLALLLL